MKLARYFLLPDGRPRAGWRLLAFIICFLLSTTLLAWLWRPEQPSFALRLIWQTAVSGGSTVIVSWVLLKILDRQPLARIGAGLMSGWAAALRNGALAGVLMVSSATGLLMLAGGLRFEASQVSWDAAAISLLQWTPIVLAAAASEELLFRGYPFQALVEGTGRVAAVLITSSVFGFLHIGNPSATSFSTMNTVLAGVMLSVAYLQARSLWYAIGLHAAWNWSLSAAGLPVSGIGLFRPPWSTSAPLETAWLHGGDYGPEGGVIATAVLMVMTAMLWRCPRKVGCRKLTKTENSGGIENSRETSFN